MQGCLAGPHNEKGFTSLRVGLELDIINCINNYFNRRLSSPGYPNPHQDSKSNVSDAAV